VVASPAATSVAPTAAYVDSTVTVTGSNFIAGFPCTAKVGPTPSSGTPAASCQCSSATTVVVVIGTGTNAAASPGTASSVQVTFTNSGVAVAVAGTQLSTSFGCDSHSRRVRVFQR
jgi:hypothetical protein